MAEQGSDLPAVSRLHDSVRARLYDCICDSDGPVGRDEAATAAGVGRALAAYHLDRLVQAGLLTAAYQRPPGRRGPGAGRPAKVYNRSGREFAVTVPPREYELAARLLAAAVEADPGGCSLDLLRAGARREGRELARRSVHGGAGGGGQAGADAVRALQSALHEHGFEPRVDAGGAIRLRNCPFRALAIQRPQVVCAMNLALVEGMVEGPVEGMAAQGLHPALDPGPDRCCVAIELRKPRSS